MTQQKSVIDWLRDAHAMEAGGVVTLTNHAEAAGDYPEVSAKLREHAEATRRHAELLEGRLAALGTGPSSLKEAVGAAFSKVAGVANLPASDTVVKNALGDLAAENFEIASYVSLIAAAEEIGDGETASVCRQILRDEEAMADWLKAQIPALTRQFLARQAGEAGGGGLLEQTKGTVQGLGGQIKAAAPDAGDTRSALLVSGALLAGAGAALLVGKALLGGSGERDRDAETADVPQYPVQPPNAEPEPAAYVGGDAALGGTPGELGDLLSGTGEGLEEQAAALDVQPGLADASAATESMPTEGAASDVLAEPVALTETLADLNDADETGVAVGQDELVAETVGGDAAFLVASEEPSATAQAASGEAEPAAPELQGGPQTAATSGGAEESGTAAGGTEGTELWRVPGPFSGLGPLEQNGAEGPLGEVYERLTQHGHVDATHIEVTLEGDRVRLGGSVDSESTKRLALAAVRGIPGVGGVEDVLEVRVTSGV